MLYICKGGSIVQSQAAQEGLLEEEGIKLDLRSASKVCFSPLPLCLFSTSLPQSPGQSLLGRSDPVTPPGCPGLLELGQKADKARPMEPGRRVWWHVSFLIRKPKDKPGHLGIEAADFPGFGTSSWHHVIESLYPFLNF